ncbi:MAG: hypothetical protein Q8K77_04420 [Thermodesulfovibrionales bacterium]|nr:hypothetical protein [Thermodesulfovibrionales bacterium]
MRCLKPAAGDVIPRYVYETFILQAGTKGNENVIARSVSDEAISKVKIVTPSARNDRIEVFSGEITGENDN